MIERIKVRPRTNPILAILLQMIFPIINAGFPAKEEVIAVANSGREVPIETTVSPMKNSPIPKCLAILEAASKKRSAPLTKTISEAIRTMDAVSRVGNIFPLLSYERKSDIKIFLRIFTLINL